MGSNPVAVTKTSDVAPVSSKELLDIQATKECRFTLKCVCYMKITYILENKLSNFCYVPSTLQKLQQWI